MGTIIHSFDRVLDRNLPVAPFGTMTSLPVRTNGSVAAEEAAGGANGIASRAEAPRWRNDSEGGWVVQKFGGTSVGKFAVNIAEDIVRASLKDNKIAVVCSARSTGKKVEGTTSRLLEVFGVLEEVNSVKDIESVHYESLVTEYERLVHVICEDHVHAAHTHPRRKHTSCAGKRGRGRMQRDCRVP